MAFRDRLERVGDYFVLDGRLHGPDEQLPVVLTDATTCDVQRIAVDRAQIFGLGLASVVSLVLFAMCTLHNPDATTERPLLAGMAIFGLIGVVAAIVTTIELVAVVRLRRGAELVIHDRDEELTLWFPRRADAERVRGIIAAKSSA